MTGHPLVSIVVCTRNRIADIEQRLPSVVTSAVASTVPVEVIVVDNGSTDGTAEFLARRFPEVRVVREEVLGSARARNTGIAASRGRFVLFTDDDVETPPEWVDRMVAPLASGDADVVAGAVVAHASRVRPWMSELLLTELAHVPAPSASHPEIVGASFGARRDVLSEIGFDEVLARPPYQRSDDTFFGMRAQERGLRILAVPGAPVLHHYHLGRLETPAIERLLRSGGRARAYLWHHWLYADVPRLRIKSIVFRMQRALSLPRLRRHPSDHDLRLLAEIAFIDELRRLAGTPKSYPAPADRTAVGS